MTQREINWMCHELRLGPSALEDAKLMELVSGTLLYARCRLELALLDLRASVWTLLLSVFTLNNVVGFLLVWLIVTCILVLVILVMGFVFAVAVIASAK